MPSRDTVLAYFRHELNYLRTEGVRFGRRFPKLASRLALSERGSDDPHVERLLEGVAFLTARVQHAIDDQLPSLARHFIEAQHPHYLRPVPSMATVSLELQVERAPDIVDVVDIPRGLQLGCRLEDGTNVRFQTCYDTRLWPLVIEDARFGTVGELGGASKVGADRVLRVRLRRPGKDAELGDLDWSKPLRLAFDGDPATRSHLLELFADAYLGVEVFEADGASIRREGGGTLEPSRVETVGFGRDEEVLPYASRSHGAYRLVHEYFASRRKFEFVDVHLPALAHAKGAAVDLYFAFSRRPGASIHVDRNTLRLGVTPVINLFPQVAEPIIFDRRTADYRVVPDNRWERSLEVHSIAEVFEAAADGKLVRIAPFHSGDILGRSEAHEEHGWLAHRRPTSLEGAAGDDLYLSIAETFDEAEHSFATAKGYSTVHVHTMCTNREVASRLVAGQLLSHELDLPVVARLLTSPTPRSSFNDDAETVRRLVALVSSSSRALLEPEGALTYLRGVLSLFAAPGSAGSPPELRVLEGVETRLGARYLPQLRANARGIDVSLRISAEAMYPLSTWNLEAVLSQFLRMTTPLGTYSRLTVIDEERDTKRVWPATIEGRQV